MFSTWINNEENCIFGLDNNGYQVSKADRIGEMTDRPIETDLLGLEP